MNIDKEEIIILIKKFKEKSISWNEAESLLFMLVRDYELKPQPEELSDEREDILALRARMLDVETDVNDLKKGVAPLTEEFVEEFSDALKEQISPPTVLALKTIEELKAQLKEQAEEIQSTKGIRDAVASHNESLTGANGLLVKENEELVADNKFLTEHHQFIANQCKDLKDENDHTNSIKKRLVAANDRLVKQNDELRREVVDFEKTRRILDSNIKDLIKEAADANFRHQEIVRWHDPGEGNKNLMFDVEELRKENISLRREAAKKAMSDRLMGEIP